jgi:hypothetical protein
MVLDTMAWHLVYGLALALILAQGLAWSLARGLSAVLPARVQVIGLCLPLVVLLPLLHGHRIVAPTDAPILANLPDAPRVAHPDTEYGVFNDAILQLLPWEAEVRRSFADGHLPLWSDLLDGGSSPWVNPQAAVLSPVAMLGRLLPLEHFLLGTIAVKLLLAFEGCWLLARALGAGRWGAALGAAGFALGGPVVAWAVFPLSSVVAWSPWLTLGAVRVVRRPTCRHAAAAALALAALLLSGHPEIAAAECVVAAGVGMAVWRRASMAYPPLGAAVLAAALGACLAACQVVPFLLVAPHSVRASQGESHVAAVPLRLFPRGDERLFLSVMNPWSFGRPLSEPFAGPGNWPIACGGYLGLVALAGMAAAMASRRRKLVFALAILALGLTLVAAGFYPCRWLLGVLPLGRALAFDRFLPAAALPLALLAAIGLEELLAPRRLAGCGMALIAAGASLAIRHDAFLVALWLLVVVAVLLARRRPPATKDLTSLSRLTRRWRIGAAALLALASLLDLVSWDRGFLPRGHGELFYPRTPLVDAIAAAAGAGPWRAVAGGFGIYPSLLPMYGIADVRIDNPLALVQQLRPLSAVFEFRPEGRRYKSAFRNIGHPFLDFLNVRAVVLPAAAPPPRRFELAHAGSPLQVYRNPSALPRFFLPAGADVRGRDEVLGAICDIRDARRVVLTREEVGDWRAPERVWNPGAVTLLNTRPGLVSLLLPAAGEKLLATSLPFPAGWTATFQGRALRPILVNAAYLGVVVPPGAARVELHFAPPGFRLGMALSALGALALLLLFAVPARVRKETPVGQPR